MISTFLSFVVFSLSDIEILAWTVKALWIFGYIVHLAISTPSGNSYMETIQNDVLLRYMNYLPSVESMLHMLIFVNI